MSEGIFNLKLEKPTAFKHKKEITQGHQNNHQNNQPYFAAIYSGVAYHITRRKLGFGQM